MIGDAILDYFTHTEDYMIDDLIELGLVLDDIVFIAETFNLYSVNDYLLGHYNIELELPELTVLRMLCDEYISTHYTDFKEYL